MHSYEVMFIKNPALEIDDSEKLLERLTQVIGDKGGSVINIDRRGKRKLAYEIEGHQEGNYTLVTFQGGPEVVAEVERHLRIADAVIRHLLVKQEG